jgi:hypothetical protein
VLSARSLPYETAYKAAWLLLNLNSLPAIELTHSGLYASAYKALTANLPARNLNYEQSYKAASLHQPLRLLLNLISLP